MSDAKAGPDAVVFKPGDPNYVFPKEVHNLLVLANSTNITLSGMADTKASILMGASFVVFSLQILAGLCAATAVWRQHTAEATAFTSGGARAGE